MGGSFPFFCLPRHHPRNLQHRVWWLQIMSWPQRRGQRSLPKVAMLLMQQLPQHWLLESYNPLVLVLAVEDLLW